MMSSASSGAGYWSSNDARLWPGHLQAGEFFGACWEGVFHLIRRGEGDRGSGCGCGGFVYPAPRCERCGGFYNEVGSVTGQKGTRQLKFVHDAEGRLVSVNDPATGPVITYNYDARGRRTGRSPQTGGAATRFVYDGSVCIQELGTDNISDMTFVCADGIRQCISTRNGTVYYPQGGGTGSSAAQERQPEWEKLEGVLCVGTCDASLHLITSASGAPVERFDCDDAGKPIFLTSEGLPSSSTGSAIGLRWMAPECAWEPEIGMFAGPGGIYSPDLGTTVSKVKSLTDAIGKPRERLSGTVSLLK